MNERLEKDIEIYGTAYEHKELGRLDPKLMTLHVKSTPSPGGPSPYPTIMGVDYGHPDGGAAVLARYHRDGTIEVIGEANWPKPADVEDNGEHKHVDLFINLFGQKYQYEFYEDGSVFRRTMPDTEDGPCGEWEELCAGS